MNKNKIDELISKAKSIKNIGIGGKHDIDVLEKYLDVLLTSDLSYIYSKYSFDFFSSFDLYGVPCGIIDGTCEYRERGLPHRYIVLADNGDAGIVLMETQADRDKPSPVIWCDYPDIFNLCECGEFKLNPDIWPSFTDFFEYLIEREEKLQNEELN